MGKRTNSAAWLPNQKRWQILVQKNGVRKAFPSSKPGRTGQREANRKADLWLDEGVTDTREPISVLYPQWIAELQMTTSCSNWRPVDGRWRNWVKPVLGERRVDDLSEQLLQKIVNRGYAADLSKKTLQNICADLRAFCKWLRLSKRSTFYPEALHVPKGARSKEKEILQPDAMQTLFAEDTTLWKGQRVADPYIYAYRFSAITGLRPGELIGMQWSDVRETMVQLRRSINIYGEMTHGKNENAVRALPMTARMKGILDAQRRLTGGEKSVFCIRNEQHYYRRWCRYCDVHDIPHLPPYNLRHTFVSVAKTLPEGTVKSVVGHSRQMDTFGVYAQLLRGEAQQTALQLEDRFSQILDADLSGL